jgi:hypothetical protein
MSLSLSTSPNSDMEQTTGSDNFIWAQKLANQRMMAVERQEVDRVSFFDT